MEKDKKRILVDLANKTLGKPYKYGAKLEEAPNYFDCSSLVQYLYKQIGIDLPRTALDQASKGQEIKKENNLEIGDLIFIKGSWGHYNPEFPEGIGHVVMYVGEDKVINAHWQEKGGFVIEEPVKSYLERNDLRVIKRIL